MADEITVRMPDTLGDRGRARMVATMLSGIQAAAWNLEVEVVANDLADTSLAPPGVGVREGETVGQRREALGAAIARLETSFGAYLPLVEELLTQPKEQA